MAQTLSGSFSSLKSAQDECIKLGDGCRGVTLRNRFLFYFSVILKNLINEKSGSTYKLNAKLSFVKSSGAKAWTKEVVWAANFVPRVVWGARDPTGITDFQVKVNEFLYFY